MTAPAYFGALQLLADIEARFRVPPLGRPSGEPKLDRFVPLAPRMLKRLKI